MDNNMFGENLRKLREEKGLSQKQLGKQMFVNPSTIANMPTLPWNRLCIRTPLWLITTHRIPFSAYRR